MILFSTKWIPLKLPCELFCEIAHDGVLLVEFAYQDGEVKLHLNSPKYFQNKELKLLPDNGVIPYCLQVTGIESMSLSCEGHPELYVAQVEQSATEFHIVGSNGKISFLGRNLAVEFSMDGQSFPAIRALEQ